MDENVVGSNDKIIIEYHLFKRYWQNKRESWSFFVMKIDKNFWKVLRKFKLKQPFLKRNYPTRLQTIQTILPSLPLIKSSICFMKLNCIDYGKYIKCCLLFCVWHFKREYITTGKSSKQTHSFHPSISWKQHRGKIYFTKLDNRRRIGLSCRNRKTQIFRSCCNFGFINIYSVVMVKELQ